MSMKDDLASIQHRGMMGEKGGAMPSARAATPTGRRPLAGSGIAGIAIADELLAALKDAVGALEFSRDYHNDLGNSEQAFAQDRLDAALRAIARAEGR